MLAALTHDLGKAVATTVREDGKIVYYGHEVEGLPLCEAQMKRLTNNVKLIEYVLNMSELHMRPNMMAGNRSHKKKTRALFDLSVCPGDLILIARADATGKLDEPYDDGKEVFLRERLDDYNKVLQRPMVGGKDLVAAGLKPGEAFGKMVKRARQLHFSGLEKDKALKQVLSEYRAGYFE
jgi:tRNA nucleotidyltransferase (CCA-adding enzyme)